MFNIITQSTNKVIIYLPIKRICLEILHYMILIMLLIINGIWSRQTNATYQYCDKRMLVFVFFIGSSTRFFFILIPSRLEISGDCNVRIIMMKGWRWNSRSILHGPLQRPQVKFLSGKATNTKDNMRNRKACQISLYVLLLPFYSTSRTFLIMYPH